MRAFSSEERRARLARRHFLAPGSRADDPVQLSGGLVGLHATDPATVYPVTVDPSYQTNRAVYTDTWVSSATPATTLEAHQLQRLIVAGDPQALDAAPGWRRLRTG